MLTDWAICRRIAFELDAQLRGSRIRGAGLLADGRAGLQTARGLLAIDFEAATPYLALVPDVPVNPAPGWSRAFSETLTGLVIRAVRARRGDRLVAIECAASSRFGVSSSYRLVAELVPRFGNLLVLKEDTVVVAAREFQAGGSTRRTIARGEPYVPPPLPGPAAGHVDLDPALAALAAGDVGESALDRVARALRAIEPLLPRLVAISLASAAAGSGPALEGAEGRAGRLVARARAALAELDGTAVLSEPAYAYEDASGTLVQAHVVALQQYDGLRETRPAQLLPVVAGAYGTARDEVAGNALRAKRAALAARIGKRRRDLEGERAALERQRDAAAERDVLRRSGDALYAHLADVPAGAEHFVPPSAPDLTIRLDPELDAKANALAIFRRYKKAAARAGHADARLGELARTAEALEALAWEAERAEGDTIAEIADEFARLERPKAQRPRREKPRRALEVRLGDDARVWVGRSPRNNAELTFRIARPDDLWFHARATPGAHVVLHFDRERAATEAELLAAAELAAFHSKARSSEKVPVDYTARKYVRRRPGVAPGLVWYTNARTIVVTPKDGALP